MCADRPTISAPPEKIRPRDAATLILIDRADARAPRMLMGRRSMRHAFMPGAYVFPGGRVDRDDQRMIAADDFSGASLAKLLVEMKRGPSERRARALGLAAIRETFEETGLMLGVPGEAALRRVPAAWRAFAERSILPSLSALRFVGRATTPPGRPRRFDTRFFAAFSDAIAHCAPMTELAATELEDVRWLTFAEARRTNLPGVTLRMIGHLERRLADDPGLDAGDAPVPYLLVRHGRLAIRDI